MSKHSALGRGFDALMPTDIKSPLLAGDEERVQKLSISAILPNPDQPRKEFDLNALDELSVSIKQFGILQPIIVAPGKTVNEYIIVAGERRWRAAKLAGLKEVPAIVRTTKELEQLEIAIVENIQRVDLSPLETAASIQRLHELFNISYEQIAKKLGKAESTVSNIVRLLQLPNDAVDALAKNVISEGHARSILALKALPEKQKELLKLTKKNNWSVRQAERFVVATKADSASSEAAVTRARTSTPQTDELSRLWQRPISVVHTAKGGRVQIGFADQADLAILVDVLKSIKQK